MGGCYRCGGSGWLKRATRVQRATVRTLHAAGIPSGNSHNLNQQLPPGRIQACPVCEGRGEPRHTA